jgi:hypothetical protein
MACHTSSAEEPESLPVTLLSIEPDTIKARPYLGFFITYRWQADGPVPGNLRVRLQCVDEKGEVIISEAHKPDPPSSQWKGLVEDKQQVLLNSYIPKGAQSLPGHPEGKFDIYVSLTGARGAPKLGPGVTADPGKNRYRIGTLILDKNAPYPDIGPKTLDLSGWKMTWHDEFDDLSVSAKGPCGPGGTRWMAHTPYGGDFGDARFTDPSPDFPFVVKDGILRIEINKREGRWRGGLLSSMDSKGNGFTQKFGYWEMRAKLPWGPGTWPAFWLHGAERVTVPRSELTYVLELDILEQYGHWPGKLSSAIHEWGFNGRPKKGTGKRSLVGGMSEDFHTYGGMITEEFITIYYDGVELLRHPTPDCAKKPMYTMVNLTAGPGWPKDKTPDPSYMYVDYVRVYAKK